MFCTKCGKELPEENLFCTGCGAKVGGEETEAAPAETLAATTAEETAEMATEMPVEAPVVKSKKKGKAIIAVVIGIVVILCAWLAISLIGKASLHKQLMRDWERTESTDGLYYTLQLDFSEDEIGYNFDSLYYDDQLATFNYQVVSGNKFKIDGRDDVFKVEFNDDKTMMTITPALTSTDASENWFYHGF